MGREVLLHPPPHPSSLGYDHPYCWFVREAAQMRKALVLVGLTGMAVGLLVGFALGYLVGEKRNAIIVHEVGAQEVSARDRFLACSVPQSEVNLDELAARKRYRCYCVLMSRMGPRPELSLPLCYPLDISSPASIQSD
jgi:hypothetical protein